MRNNKPFTVWLTGLPGCGKTSVAKELEKLFKEKGVAVRRLSLDDIRKTLVPNPQYTESERESVYHTLSLMTPIINSTGTSLIIDATGYKKKWRDNVRSKANKFFEVYLECPLEICAKRESGRNDSSHDMKRMYEKALERKKTGKTVEGLGQVIGVDVDYEKSEAPELIIKTNEVSPREAAKRIYEKVMSS